MYTEFIIIYVLLVLILILAVINLVFTIKTNSEKNNGYSSINNYNSKAPNINYTEAKSNVKTDTNYSANNMNMQGGEERMVFCTKCATQFPASRGSCPNCGTPRA